MITRLINESNNIFEYSVVFRNIFDAKEIVYFVHWSDPFKSIVDDTLREILFDKIPIGRHNLSRSVLNNLGKNFNASFTGDSFNMQFNDYSKIEKLILCLNQKKLILKDIISDSSSCYNFGNNYYDFNINKERCIEERKIAIQNIIKTLHLVPSIKKYKFYSILEYIIKDNIYDYSKIEKTLHSF